MGDKTIIINGTECYAEKTPTWSIVHKRRDYPCGKEFKYMNIGFMSPERAWDEMERVMVSDFRCHCDGATVYRYDCRVKKFMGNPLVNPKSVG